MANRHGPRARRPSGERRALTALIGIPTLDRQSLFFLFAPGEWAGREDHARSADAPAIHTAPGKINMRSGRSRGNAVSARVTQVA